MSYYTFSVKNKQNIKIFFDFMFNHHFYTCILNLYRNVQLVKRLSSGHTWKCHCFFLWYLNCIVPHIKTGITSLLYCKYTSSVVTFNFITYTYTYCKVASSRLSRLVAHLRIFRLLMKKKFDAYILWPLAKRIQNWIVDRSTTHNFMVSKRRLTRLGLIPTHPHNR